MYKLFLLFVAVSLFNVASCSLYGEQLRQYFHNIYAPSSEERAVSRRNIPTVTGSGVYQEPSSRDLDVGFAVGVKDEGEASDVLINNYSSKTHSPPSPEFQNSVASYVVHEPSASKELNVGVFVDPKNGVKYFAPGFVPSSGRPNVYEFLPERYVPSTVGQNYPFVVPNQQNPLNSYQQLSTSYPVTPQIPNYINRFSLPTSNTNPIPYPYQISHNTVSLIPDTFAGSIPEESRYQQRYYPTQNYYQQPPEFDAFSGVSYIPNNLQIPGTVYRSPMTANVYDEGVYSGRFSRSHGRLPYQNFDTRYKIPFKNLHNIFQVQEQVPRGSYGHLAEPVIEREEPQTPEIIRDQQGRPVMSAQPYGERQVGAFKLRNDHGYQVTMNVPPVAGDGSADGVLVMEMKANLYRPLS